jgi:hypothetical protein
MSRAGFQQLADLHKRIIDKGAYAGVVAACDNVTSPSQVQNLLEIVGAYSYPEVYSIISLYVAYQVARGGIGRETGRIIFNDVKWIHDEYNRLPREEKERTSFEELLRRYLGSLKWSYIAVTRGRMYGACRALRSRMLSVDTIAILQAMFQR